jgi:glycosyltransferase involved in cell wall biosynthesis
LYRRLVELKAQGFEPDAVIAHPGWGESLFVKDVWPATRLGIYCEFNYQERGLDVGFDQEFSLDGPTDPPRLRLKNLNNVMHFSLADAAVSPTHFQADTFPMPFRKSIQVLHDGIDTERISPNDQAELALPNGGILKAGQEIITFANRNLEPYRGYHVFMRALPDLLKKRPKAHVVIVGGDGVSYGRRPSQQGQSWKNLLIEEVRPLMKDSDWARVHFLPLLPRDEFLKVLQVSRVHVYLTYPFVASWSLLEAMSAGCAIVASGTEPVKEFIRSSQNGLLFPFFEKDHLVASVCKLLDDEKLRLRLGRAARRRVMAEYDLKEACLPQLVLWAEKLGKPKRSAKAVV